MTEQELTNVLDLVRLVAGSPYPGGHRVLVIVRRPDGTMHWADAGLAGDVNLPALLADSAGEQARLRAERDRLQGLIKAAEWEGYDGTLCCPWCQEDAPWPDHPEKCNHAAACPAFSAPGVLR